MTNKHRTLSAIVFFLSLCLLPLGEASAFTGRVVDAATGKPVTDAVVTLQNRATRSDAGGIFRIDGTGATLGVRAPGYQRLTVATNRLAAARGEIRLQPFQAKGLYLSIYGIGDRGLRNSAKQLIRDTDLNTLIIDIKGDRGLVPHKPGLPWTTQTGAEKVTTVRDMKEMVDSLHADNIYLIARIVVFKDDLLAQSRPEWAIKNSNGQVWKDKEDLRWIDPFQKEAWRYTIDIAVEAAKLGFDEIQFDYIRFPDTKGLVFSKPNTEEARVEAISGFLTKARLTLIPY
ncbi:MAG: carboxypeptidase regulatory-like domain-containing protein, partial [Desulfobulbaceae bacterium]|nr:carboxypeptidase regulatory-like domain-containing protein [Desulfobulbaceae bacterium]